MAPTDAPSDRPLPDPEGDERPPSGAAGHPTEDAWVRFAGRELDAAERAAMADHIVACAECARVYRAVSEVTRGAAAFDVAVPPRSRWREHLALAASVALAVAGWTWLIPAAPMGVPVPDTTAPPATVADAGTVAVSSPAVPAWAALGEAPGVRLPSSLTLAVRGPRDDAEAFMQAFGTAMAPYRAGRFTAAASALAAVTAAHPAVPEGWFYRGVAHLHGGDPAAAVEPLRRAAGSSVVGDDALWLEAVALARAGRAAEAQRALQALCAAAGPNRARACAAAERP